MERNLRQTIPNPIMHQRCQSIPRPSKSAGFIHSRPSTHDKYHTTSTKKGHDLELAIRTPNHIQENQGYPNIRHGNSNLRPKSGHNTADRRI